MEKTLYLEVAVTEELTKALYEAIYEGLEQAWADNGMQWLRSEVKREAERQTEEAFESPHEELSFLLDSYGVQYKIHWVS